MNIKELSRADHFVIGFLESGEYAPGTRVHLKSDPTKVGDVVACQDTAPLSHDGKAVEPSYQVQWSDGNSTSTVHSKLEPHHE